MTGKDPHRPEGKAGVNEWHQRQRDAARSEKHLRDLRPPEKRGVPKEAEPHESFPGGRRAVSGRELRRR